MLLLNDIPLEIWLRILDYASSDDGKTSISLSATSRYLRDVSRFHRHHSVVIKGWRQLVGFEQVFFESSKDSQRITNLYVNIPELYSVAYPPESWFEELASEDDSTYVPSDDGWETEDDSVDEHPDAEDAGIGDLVDEEDDPLPFFEREDSPPPSPAESESSDSESCSDDSDSESISDGEYDETSPEELVEILEEAEDVIKSESLDGYIAIHGQDLSMLRTPSSPLCRLELKVFSTLRRILEAAAPTLEILTLCWQPSSTLYPEAVFPVLPKLRSLAILKDPIHSEAVAPVKYKFKLERVLPIPKLFPALERFNFNTSCTKSFDRETFSNLLNPPLRFISAPKGIIKYLAPLPSTVEEVRVYRHEGEWQLTDDEIEREIYGRAHTRSDTAVYCRASEANLFEDPDDFLRDWLNQVSEWCSDLRVPGEAQE